MSGDDAYACDDCGEDLPDCACDDYFSEYEEGAAVIPPGDMAIGGSYRIYTSGGNYMSGRYAGKNRVGQAAFLFGDFTWQVGQSDIAEVIPLEPEDEMAAGAA